MTTTATPAKKAIIEITDIKHVNKGSLKAFVTVTVAGKIKIHSIRVIQQDGQAPWTSMPQTEVPNQNGGKSKYFPIVEILDELLKNEICAAVLRSWQPPSAVPTDEDIPF